MTDPAKTAETTAREQAESIIRGRYIPTDEDRNAIVEGIAESITDAKRDAKLGLLDELFISFQIKKYKILGSAAKDVSMQTLAFRKAVTCMEVATELDAEMRGAEAMRGAAINATVHNIQNARDKVMVEDV